MIGLAFLYPAREWSVCAPGHRGYPRASDLILGKALRGRLGHQRYLRTLFMQGARVICSGSKLGKA